MRRWPAPIVWRAGAFRSRLDLLPIDADRLRPVGVEEDERLVALLKRVEQLIVLAQDQLFTSLAVLSDVKAKLERRRGYAELMEKLGPPLERGDCVIGGVGGSATGSPTYPVASERQAAILDESVGPGSRGTRAARIDVTA